MLLLQRHSHSYLMHVCKAENTHTLPSHLAVTALHLVLHAISSHHLAGWSVWSRISTGFQSGHSSCATLAQTVGGKMIYDMIPPV